MTAAVQSTETSTARVRDLQDSLRRLKEGARARGVTTSEERIEVLDKLERAVIARKDALARAASSDFGNRSRHETLLADVFPTVTAIRYARAHLREWMEPEDRETSWVLLPSTSQVVYQPLGVVGIMSPWNYPVVLALGPLVAALAAGNSAMLKPSELAPQTSELLRDLVAETFGPDHVVVVTGGADVGEEFSRLPFDHLLFTGSTRVGRLVMRAASENLVPVTLELGGKSPAIVGPDFNARTAAARIMAGKTLNAGQTCLAPDYAFVPANVRETFIEACRAAVAKAYPTLENNADYTALVNDAHYTRLRAIVDDAKSRGARVVELNPANESLSAAARKMAPTLIVDPTDEMLCMKDEIFGPVLPVKTYARPEEAIAYVIERARPLGLYYFGYDRAAIDRVLAQTASGGVTVNETMLHFLQDDLPFGGVGASGIGQYHGRHGFLTFSQQRAVYRQSRVSASRMLRPPYGKLADRLLHFLIGS